MASQAIESSEKKEWECMSLHRLIRFCKKELTEFMKFSSRLEYWMLSAPKRHHFSSNFYHFLLMTKTWADCFESNLPKKSASIEWESFASIKKMLLAKKTMFFAKIHPKYGIFVKIRTLDVLAHWTPNTEAVGLFIKLLMLPSGDKNLIWLMQIKPKFHENNKVSTQNPIR